MRKSITTSAIFVLIVLYVAASWLQTRTVVLNGLISQTSDQTEHPLLNPFTSTLYCTPSRSEMINHSIMNGGNHTVKDNLTKENPSANPGWHTIEKKYTTYFYSTLNFFLSLKKSDIIYPFHNFW